jgi:hypothetical protein
MLVCIHSLTQPLIHKSDDQCIDYEIGKSTGAFTDIDRLTSFADYRLPQLLRQIGIMKYYPHHYLAYSRHAFMRFYLMV